jgi:ComF family protein
MGNFFLSILDALLPPRKTELLVRTLTLEQLQRLSATETLPYHDARVQALVWELKYYASNRAAYLAGQYLSEQVLSLAAEELGTALLVPVPMHKKRRKARGHNQTEVLCEVLLPFCAGAVVYAPKALQRVVDTPTQQGRPKAERVKNVMHSMAADEKIVRGRACIVIDDVTTTGATLAEAQRALKAAGARAVHTAALAHS